MHLLTFHFSTLVACIILALIVMFLLAYFVVKVCKRNTATDDLIYLEMLIKSAIIDPLYEKSIRSKIVDLRSREDIDQDKLEKLNVLFRERFADKNHELLQIETE